MEVLTICDRDGDAMLVYSVANENEKSDFIDQLWDFLEEKNSYVGTSGQKTESSKSIDTTHAGRLLLPLGRDCFPVIFYGVTKCLKLLKNLM
jgi:hypothetical protein